MAKKKSHKKQSFKYGEPSAKSAEPKAASVQPSEKLTVPAQVAVAVDHPFLSGDLRRLTLVGGGLVVIELVLWYVFGHTSFGTTVYNLYHVGS